VNGGDVRSHKLVAIMTRAVTVCKLRYGCVQVSECLHES
jgi:hypothetical protein